MAQKSTKKHNLADLERLYTEAEQADKDLFAEQRSNILLASGDHYQKKHSTFFSRLRTEQALTEQQKLRLTKNHIQKICKIYVNNIVGLAPGVGVEPKNESELQDQKAAEINHAVWQDALDRHNFKDLVDDFGDDFIHIGEVATKLFWDPGAGEIKSYSQKLDEAGMPLFYDAEGNETTEGLIDPMTGEPRAEMVPGTPQYTGDIVFEPIYGFNLLRAPEAKDMKKSPFLIIRKMVDVADLIARFPDHEKIIKPSMDETMVVFDGQKGGYVEAHRQVMLKEIYFRPCATYPKGYFYFWVKEGVLTQNELPGGIFPIRFQSCEKIQTSPRGRSIIKVMRPYQAEINRAASKMAEHQITLGDDKILIQNGTKISAGAALPGVRSVNYTGAEPVVMAGRDGSQYLNYMQAQIAEMYEVMSVNEIKEEKTSAGQMDPYTLLFSAAREKRKFQRYVRRFESFLVDVCETYLELAKIHLSDDAVIYAAGKKERINIPEFKSSEKLCYQIKLVPQADDVETKLGKQLVLNHALQYVGAQLGKEDIGKLIRAMPYSNVEESFADLTQDYDSGTNLILALDRGETPPLSDYDNFVYLIKRLTGRMRQADFKFLDQTIQQNYVMAMGKLQQMEVERVKAVQMAQKGFIPTGGYMVSVDLYVSDPQNPLKTRHARVPYQSLEWLIQALEAQGQTLEQLESMNQGALAEMAQLMGPNGGGQPAGMGASPPPQPTEMGGRVANEQGRYGRTGQ